MESWMPPHWNFQKISSRTASKIRQLSVTSIGPYELVSELGLGGMGAVYLGGEMMADLIRMSP